MAAEIAIVSRDSHYKWLRDDATYKERFDQAQAQANDKLLQEARRRAEKGWLEPVYQKGVKVGVRRRHSDRLMLALLSAEMPEKFSQKREVRHTGSVEHKHQIQVYIPDNQRQKVIDVDRNGNGKHPGDPPALGTAGDIPVEPG